MNNIQVLIIVTIFAQFFIGPSLCGCFVVAATPSTEIHIYEATCPFCCRSVRQLCYCNSHSLMAAMTSQNVAHDDRLLEKRLICGIRSTTFLRSKTLKKP